MITNIGSVYLRSYIRIVKGREQQVRAHIRNRPKQLRFKF